MSSPHVAAEVLADRLTHRLAQMPSELARAAAASAVLAGLGVLFLALVGTVVGGLVGAELSRFMPVSPYVAFSGTHFAVMIGLTIVTVFAAAWVEETFFSRPPPLGTVNPELNQSPQHLAFRLLFCVPHLVWHALFLVRDALRLARVPVDPHSAARLLLATDKGASTHELEGLGFDSRSMLAALTALEHAGYLRMQLGDQEHWGATIEGHQLMRDR